MSLIAKNVPPGPQIIDADSFSIILGEDPEFAELVIKDAVLYDDRVARETKSLLEQLRPGKKYYLVVSSIGFFRVSKKARKLGASKAFSNHLSAVAFYTTNASLLLIGELYNKINKPAVSTRIFASKEAAIEWLNEQRSLHLAQV